MDRLKPGQSAVIQAVGGSGSLRHHLLDMGLTPQTEVTLQKTAPMGDPVQIKLRGYELTLRLDEARKIEIGAVYQKTGVETRPLRYQAIDHPAVGEQSTVETDHPKKTEGIPAGQPLRFALAGNQNCGKTTLFNQLTGANQHVGNFPGVTVDRKDGTIRSHPEATVTDLPGIYSLSPYSMEEIVARSFVVDEHPDAIINIIDATNIERNLYLTAQLLELERPMVIALNFMDEVEKRGDKLDVDRISRALGVPVIPITARTGENVQKLLELAHHQMHTGFTVEPDDLYDEFTHQIHHEVDELIHDRAYAVGIPAHWASIKLIEGDELVAKALDLDDATRWKVDAVAHRYEQAYPLGDRETLIADARYRFIQQVVKVSVQRGQPLDALTVSDRIDAIVTNKYLAVPAFLLVMLLMFTLTFGPGKQLSNLLDYFLNSFLAVRLSWALTQWGVASWVHSLLIDGILSGVGGVLTFLPQIAILFLFLSFLEDSGYMSRAAFIMDRLLRRFGLSGKAFIPMLMGFGCTVPAIMGARTMENEKDRRMTIMLVPFMSCSARLPVYGLIASAFFPRYAGLVIFSLYLLGLLCAILSGIILRRTMFRGEPAAFVLELPPYRMPTAHNCLMHVWERVRGFLVKAGTLILAMSVILWFLQSFGFSGGLHMVNDPADSILGSIGTLLTPLFVPLGFGVWQAVVALLTGLVAKEAVVSTLCMLYGFSTLDSGATVAAALSSTFPTPAAAYAFLVFILLYVPCVAAVSTLYREMNSLRWTVRSVLWQLCAAWLVSFLVFQIGSLLI